MLREGFTHAAEDRDARALAEQRVEAASLLQSIAAALARDADLLDSAEREALDAARRGLEAEAAGTDHRRIKRAIERLNAASGTFAARRMDRAISGALAGRRVDDVPGVAPHGDGVR
jgi:molecular chaperone HscA